MVSNLNLALISATAVAGAIFLCTIVDAIGTGSCKDICNTSGTDGAKDCQCNSYCIKYEDCCGDYTQLCLGSSSDHSCQGNCDAPMNSDWPCQCNLPCLNYGDCCADYNNMCGVNSGPAVTDADLVAISENLHTAESDNNANSFINVDRQGKTIQGSAEDLAPFPLLTVQPGAYQLETIALARELHKNYNADVANDEDMTEEEIGEEKKFVYAVCATPVFALARDFLISKAFLTESNFLTEFHRIWFGQYSRASGYVGSSGFEHVFLGELKNGGVSGFHNWIFFHNEETNGNMNYRGYLDYESFGKKGSLIAHNFEWQEAPKPISSMFIGTSPEFELALYTICWYSRPNAKCNIQLNGTEFVVQTYDITYGGEKYVASSYADISTAK